MQHDAAQAPPKDIHRMQPEAPSGPRTQARIGNLGWDTDSAILTARAWEVLEKDGISAQEITALTAVTGRDGRGSGAEAMFRSEQTEPAAGQDEGATDPHELRGVQVCMARH